VEAEADADWGRDYLLKEGKDEEGKMELYARGK